MIPPVILLLVAKLSQCCHTNLRMPNTCERLLRFVQGRIQYNALLRYFIMTYLAFTLSIFLATKRFKKAIDDNNTIFWLFSVALCFLFPFATCGLLWYF